MPKVKYLIPKTAKNITPCKPEQNRTCIFLAFVMQLYYNGSTQTTINRSKHYEATIDLACSIGTFLLLCISLSYYCYRTAFFSPNNTPEDENDFSIPPGKEYEPCRDTMVRWMKETQNMPHIELSVTSFDGLRLYGKYYEYAPVEILFHGYRGTVKRDLCGGAQRCFALGRSALIVDQRGAGKSEGHTITFGIKESKDCITWVNCLLQYLGSDTKIILGGISMGAATVIMAAARGLPENVVGILADSGYTSPKEIIQKTICEMKLPPKLAYPFVKLGARLFGHFDLDELSPLAAAAECKIPLILLHCEGDGFVPREMSRRIYAACSSQKLLFTVPDGGHGLGYLADPKAYIRAVGEFTELCRLSVHESVFTK